MTSTRGTDFWTDTFVRHVAIVLIFATFAISAQAQVAGSDEPPPVRAFIDTNGVDLLTGELYFSDVQVSVGVPGRGGLARVFFGGPTGGPGGVPSGRDSLTGTLNSNGNIYTISLGQSSVAFSLSGSVFSNLSGDGSTLTLTNSTTYTFVSRDGTQAVFSTSWANGGGCCITANVARVTSITRPNGEVLTYSYSNHFVTNPATFTITRPEAVTNNFGYEIKYLYVTSNNSVTDSQISKVIGINNAVDYCAPTSTSCTGLTTNWTYITTQNGNTGQVTDILGRVTTYPKVTANSTVAWIRPSGVTVNVTFDASGRVTAVATSAGTWHYSYVVSGSNQTTTVTDPNTHTRVVVLNTANGTVTSNTDGVGNKTSYLYDSFNRAQTITRQELDSIGYTYDARGNVTKTVNTGKDKVTTITTSANFDTTCSFPAKCNQPNYTIDGNGHETNYTYNTSTGQPLTIVRPTGANSLRPETDFTYTSEYAWYKGSAGTILRAASPISMMTKVSQCATAQTCAGTVNAAQSTYVYGTSGVANNLLITSTTQGAGDGSLAAITQLAYDSVGNLYTVNDPLLRTTRYHFDTVRQLTGVVGPDPDGAGQGPLHNRAVKITYECDSSVKAGCDGLITKTEQGTVLSQADSDWGAFATLGQRAITYDGVDRKSTDIYSSGSTYIGATQFSYDAANRLTCQTQRMNPNALTSLPAACSLGTQGSAGPDRITYLTYDNADKLLKTTVGYGTSVQADVDTKTYGGDGEVMTRADANGHLTTLIHDTFNRIYQAEFPTPSNGTVSSTSDYEQYTYDNNGNITQNRRRDGTLVNFGYDALNLRTSGYNGATFGYDNLRRMTSAAVSGNSESFGYDALNRQTSETTASVGTVNRTYDLVGNMTQLTYPSSYYVKYGFDAANELTGMTDSNAVTLLQEVYDNLGRITSTTRGANGPSESRNYGSDLRLSTQQYSFSDTSKNVTYTYTWNLAGQPMSMTPNNSLYSNATSPAATSYLADGQNRYTTVGGHTMAYDSRSNLTNDGTNSFTFDGLNRTTAANNTSYSFDALDRLTTQTYSGLSPVQFVYSGQQLIAVYSGGALQDTYVPNLGLDQTALWYFGASTAISNARWLVSNAFGSVVSAGSPTNGPGITTYDAFGSSGSSGLASQNGGMGFKGMIQLSAGIYSARARTYNATLGRFLQSDPAGYVDGLHLYSFVHNSPVNGADPTGLTSIWKRGRSALVSRYHRTQTNPIREIRPQLKGINEWTTSPTNPYAFEFTAPYGYTLSFNGFNPNDPTVGAGTLESNTIPVLGNSDFNAPVGITITWEPELPGTPYTVDFTSQNQQNIQDGITDTQNSTFTELQNTEPPADVTIEPDPGDGGGGDNTSLQPYRIRSRI